MSVRNDGSDPVRRRHGDSERAPLRPLRLRLQQHERRGHQRDHDGLHRADVRRGDGQLDRAVRGSVRLRLLLIHLGKGAASSGTRRLLEPTYWHKTV